MSFQESPAQRAARAGRDAFFGRAALGPALPATSNVRESPQQAARRESVREFFETKTVRESSVGKPQPAPSLRPTLHQATGSKTVNQALQKPGKIIFQDCDGAETGRLEWDRRRILTEGEQIIRTGCEDSSSYPV